MRHADEMAAVLAFPSLYRFTGGVAPTTGRLRARYRSQVRGSSSDGSQGWLNWIVRVGSGAAVGYVQATLERDGGTDRLVAGLGWIIAPFAQGRGIATRASARVVEWLSDAGVQEFRADIHPGNTASARVARKLGLVPSSTIVDREVRWILVPGR